MSRSALAVLPWIAFTFVAFAAPSASAGEPLMAPPPRASTNGAVHYQRAVLFSSYLGQEDHELLSKPIWEIVTPGSSEADLQRVNEVLLRGRHAIRSAVIGARQNSADFGLDIDQYLLGSYVPHADPMTRVGRLVALDAVRQQGAGDWRLAAERLLAVLAMGRDMAKQPTLAEVIAAVEILETGYFALGQWAVRCPDQDLVSDVSNIVNAMAIDMINPARPMYFEASIAKMRAEAIRDAFPDGAWAEMALESMGQPAPNTNREQLRAAAIDAAVERGVPRSAFDSKASFDEFSTKVNHAMVALCNEAAACLALDSPAAIRRAQQVHDKYDSKFLQLERVRALDPEKTAQYFAIHNAELGMLRVVLAASAAKTDAGFPADAAAVAEAFGGTLPTSPYDGKPYAYQTLNDGQGLSVRTAGVKIGEVELPEIHFRYEPAGN